MRMYQRGRPVDNGFEPTHLLYYRCEAKSVDGDRLLPPKIGCVNISCNWSKYSKAKDVIFDHPRHGIVQWLVEHIPKGQLQNVGVGKRAKSHKFDFQPTHCPDPKNYSHSEIWTYKDGVRREDGPSDEMKKTLRTILSDRGVMIRKPSA
jgi:hypothetical protein